MSKSDVERLEERSKESRLLFVRQKRQHVDFRKAAKENIRSLNAFISELQKEKAKQFERIEQMSKRCAALEKEKDELERNHLDYVEHVSMKFAGLEKEKDDLAEIASRRPVPAPRRPAAAPKAAPRRPAAAPKAAPRRQSVLITQEEISYWHGS